MRVVGHTGEKIAIISERNLLALIDLTIPLEIHYQIYQIHQKMSLKYVLHWPYLPILQKLPDSLDSLRPNIH